MTRRSTSLVFLVLMTSGCAGLMYEIVWTRQLMVFFGNGTHSVVAVISAFLGGLALGSYFFGRRIDRFSSSSLLRLYARLEIGTAVFAVATFWLIPAILPLFRHFSDGSILSPSLLALKFALTVPIVIVPTLFMGGTLPVMIAAWRGEQQTDRVFSLYYAINTLGGVIGVLLAGFVSIELLGLRATVLVAVGLNILAAIASRFMRLASPTTGRASEGPAQPSSRLPSVGLWVFGLSGFVAIGLEVLWTRMLTPIMGTAVYAFAAILAIYLVGITFGSLGYPFLRRRSVSAGRAYGIALVIIAVSATLSVFFRSHFVPSNQILALVTVVLPATIGMGLAFPAGLAHFWPHSSPGRTVGRAYFFNTVGSIAGSFVVNFWLIPTVGSGSAVIILAMCSAVLALFILARYRSHRLPDYPLLGAVGSIFIGILLITTGRPSLVEGTAWQFLHDASGPGVQARYLEDSVASVLAYHNQNNGVYKLLVDGIGITGRGSTTRLMAYVPAAVNPDPRRALIVAFGMGSTFRAALNIGLQADVVDLTKSVPAMFPYFFNDAKAVLANPGGRVIINDGRNFVALGSSRYDIVTIDPPPPFNSAGTTVLYAEEFYRDIAKRLNPHGLVSQWLYFDTQTSDIAMATKSFLNVFPYVMALRSPQLSTGMYLLGSYSPVEFSPGRLADVFAQPAVVRDLADVDLTLNPAAVTKLIVADRATLERFTKNSPPVRDDRPRTEYYALRHAFQPQPMMTLSALTQPAVQ